MTNIIQKHIEYLKDNPEGYWFKAKLYGWGWTPATKEGWLVTLVAIGFVIFKAVRFEQGGYPESEVFDRVVVPAFAAVGALVLVCVWKGEKPHWQFGLPKDATKSSGNEAREERDRQSKL